MTTKVTFDLSKLTIGDLRKLVNASTDLAGMIDVMNRAANMDIESLPLDEWLVVSGEWQKALNERADILTTALLLSQFDNEDETQE